MSARLPLSALIAQFGAGNFRDHFIDYCARSGLQPAAIQKILAKAELVIDRLGKTPAGKKGLLVGKVQSGKTSTFAACIVRAFECGYDFAIVLSGRDNVLNKQTFDRMKATFCAGDFSTGVQVYQTKEVIASKDNKTFIDELKRTITNKKKTVFVCLKNQQIEKLTDLLGVPMFRDAKVLVIDDEGDLASFNAKEAKAAETFTYNIIKRMLTQFNNNCTFISVTATPQAHILLAQDDAIKPDYIFTIDPGADYLGLNDFFGADQTKYVIPVSNEEKQAIENEREPTPESFKQAIIYYLVAASLFHIENAKLQKTAMLVHTAKEIVRHNLIADKINAYKRSVERFLRLRDSADAQKLIDQIKAAYASYAPEQPWTDAFLDLFICHLEHTSVNVVNSEIDDPLYKDAPNNIVVGSAMIERGVTFDNLLTTYITNRADDAIAIDTALQRGRWFGYRRRYAHLMRIFMLQRLLVNFRDQIVVHDNNLWNILVTAEANATPFAEVEKQLLISSDDLIATHKVKHNRIVFNRFHTNNNLDRTPEQRKYGEDVFNRLLADPTLNDVQVGSGNVFRMLYGVDQTKVDLIFQLPEHAKTMAACLGMPPSFWTIFHDEILPQFGEKIAIAIMDNNLAISKIRKRVIHANRSIDLFQAKNAGGNKYVGDKDWNKVDEFADYVIFQIHNVYIEATKRLQKFIALILPSKIYTDYVSSDIKKPSRSKTTKAQEATE